MKRLIFPFAAIVLTCAMAFSQAAPCRGAGMPAAAGTSDSPLLSQGPVPDLPPAGSLFQPPPPPPPPSIPNISPGLPEVPEVPIKPLTAEKEPETTATPTALSTTISPLPLAPPPIFIPQPPPPITNFPQSPTIKTTAPTIAMPTAGFSSPLAPTPTAPSQQKLNGLHPVVAENIRQLMRAIMPFRELPGSPQNTLLLRKVLNIGPLSADLMGIVRFPRIHLFQASPNETVVRDRSFGAFEYRHFGEFQTRLNGWIKPVSTNIHFDLQFKGRGLRKTNIKGAVTADGPLSGNLAIAGSDSEGRAWTIQIGLQSLLINDDGYPSGGGIQFSGTDPTGRRGAKSVVFPMPIAELPEKAGGHRGRRSNASPVNPAAHVSHRGDRNRRSQQDSQPSR